jgi:hypothetical protein
MFCKYFREESILHSRKILESSQHRVTKNVLDDFRIILEVKRNSRTHVLECIAQFKMRILIGED